MSEALPTDPERFRFSCPRDEVLHAMGKVVLKRDGDTNAVPGAFAQVTATEDEVRELKIVFGDEMRAAGLHDVRELLGHWVVVELQNSMVDVMPCKSAEHADMIYDTLLEVYENRGLFE